MEARIRSAADLGDVIRRIRTREDLTQKQLAELLGSTQRYVSELETGKPKLADDRYFTVLARLGITLTATVDERPADGDG